MARVIVELLHAQKRTLEDRFVFDNGHASLGRAYSNDIILDDPFISPRHLYISIEENQIQIQDLASENGTRVNGTHHLKDQSLKVESGDEIFIGRSVFRLLLADHPVGPALRMDAWVALRQHCDKGWFPNYLTLAITALGVWFGYMGSPGGSFWKESFVPLFIAYIGSIHFFAICLSGLAYHNFRRVFYLRNLMVAGVGTLISLFYEQIEPFLYFWILSPGVVVTLDLLFSIFIFALMFWASLRLSGDVIFLKDKIRIASLAVIFSLLIAYVNKDIHPGFVEDPKYHTHIAPWLGPIFEPTPLDTFIEQSGKKLFSR